MIRHQEMVTEWKLAFTFDFGWTRRHFPALVYGPEKVPRPFIKPTVSVSVEDMSWFIGLTTDVNEIPAAIAALQRIKGSVGSADAPLLPFSNVTKEEREAQRIQEINDAKYRTPEQWEVYRAERKAAAAAKRALWDFPTPTPAPGSSGSAAAAEGPGSSGSAAAAEAPQSHDSVLRALIAGTELNPVVLDPLPGGEENPSEEDEDETWEALIVCTASLK